MKPRLLFYNARVHTQANTRHKYARLVVDSIAVNKGTIVAVGNDLQHDPDFKSYDRINLKGRCLTPGFVDAHTHFVFYGLSLDQISLQDQTTLEGCLRKIKTFATRLKKSDWIQGEGYIASQIQFRGKPMRHLLDAVSGGRPVFIFSKDQHSAWCNSRALELAGIHADTHDPEGGRIDRVDDGTPSGILYEGPAESLVLSRIPEPSFDHQARSYQKALKIAYERGVTGVHCFDDPSYFPFLVEMAEKGKIGLRMNYYPTVGMLEALERTGTTDGTGTDSFRVAGIKIFSDGSLGSQTAHCFTAYPGTKDKGVEVTTVSQMRNHIKRAASLGFPCAIHAIGDRAVSNVLDAFESSPKLPPGVRHRIEHMQLMRRSDIKRVRKMGVIGSMQPSHCPSDIDAIRRFWGQRSANASMFRTLIDNGVDLAFGSDVPIEPLNPIHGMAAAVRRALPGSRDVFYPEQRITAAEALYNFTVGPAIASGEADRRGFLLPGYPADFVILNQDLTHTPPTQLYDVKVLATFIDGEPRYADSALKL